MLANSGQIWFYHAPSKKVEERQQILVPAASQIPGLAALDELDQEAWEREVGVKKQKRAKESDSHYIRLAKQGGRKNLLAFSTGDQEIRDICEEPKHYSRVEWFDHHESDLEKDKQILAHAQWQLPEYMVHVTTPEPDDSIRPSKPEDGKVKKKRAPFYSDNFSVWKRPEEEIIHKSNRRQRNPGQNLKDVAKLPELTVKSQKSPPVSFSKLIGGEYGNEWYRDQGGRPPVRVHNREHRPIKGYLNMSEYQQNICRKVISPKKLKPIVLNQPKGLTAKTVDKPMFKLSKFSKVESKLKTGAN